MRLTNQELGMLGRDHRHSPPLPAPRGPVSSYLLEHLREPVHALPPAPDHADDPLDGDDAALALYVAYELHYRGFDGVDERWEWDPGLLAVRARWEQAFEQRVREVAGPIVVLDDVAERLYALLDDDAGPSLSRWILEHATLEQLLELHVHRSAYQLKEADPHSWALPRLHGPAKAALVEIQADEYGQGVEKDMHAELFALTMRELGLDDGYGAYLDAIPGVTLATVNLATFFGLHRRLRGALVGHLAIFEMTSVEPMGRYSAALRRHGFGPWARLFYDTHVVADAHHQTVAARELAGGLVREEPHLVADVLLGAQALSAMERSYTEHLIASFSAGRTSLRVPLRV
jgi:hypothetical protein